MMLGFDYVIGSQLAALSEFQKFFGVQQPDGSWIIPATYLSAWGAIGLGCDVIASWLAAPLLEKYGRKPLILFSAFVSVVAIILQQLATNWRVHLAGRAVNGAWFLLLWAGGLVDDTSLTNLHQALPSASCLQFPRYGLARRAARNCAVSGCAFVRYEDPASMSRCEY